MYFAKPFSKLHEFKTQIISHNPNKIRKNYTKNTTNTLINTNNTRDEKAKQRPNRPTNQFGRSTNTTN